MKQLFSDIKIMTWRNMVRYVRLPQLLVFSTIQPVMFVILFAYVFGSAINVGGINYISFLLPGIIVQTMLFGSTQTGVGLSEDISRGMIDRFRSLPMARSAVLAGRTISDSLRNVFVGILMTLVGLLIGFRWHDGIFHFADAIGIAVLFGFAFSWISANIGLFVKNSEAAQVAGFIWVFPLAFISSIFVPTQGMPLVFKWFAEHSPVTATVNAVRGLALGGLGPHDIRNALLWILVLLIVFVPLAVRQYRRIS